MSASTSHNRSDSGGGSAGRKKRPRPLPHVNARNLAIEKKRREQMNGNFLDLAYLVPSLANTQRLTKVHIVNQTIEYLREQRDLCASAARDMQELLAENYRLVAQVNVLRSAAAAFPLLPGGAAEAEAPAAQVRPMPGTMTRLLNACSLGHGTATLRDANEGPEPRCKASPPLAEQTEIPPLLSTTILSDVSKDVLLETNDCPSLWDATGFDFTGSSGTGQLQPPWPLSAPPPVSPGGIFSILPSVDAPTSPGIDFQNALLTSFPYPIDSVPNTSLHTISLDHDSLGNPWPGLGIC